MILVWIMFQLPPLLSLVDFMVLQVFRNTSQISLPTIYTISLKTIFASIYTSSWQGAPGRNYPSLLLSLNRTPISWITSHCPLILTPEQLILIDTVHISLHSFSRLTYLEKTYPGHHHRHLSALFFSEGFLVLVYFFQNKGLKSYTTRNEYAVNWFM